MWATHIRITFQSPLTEEDLEAIGRDIGGSYGSPEGFRAYWILADPERLTLTVVGLWDSREALVASSARRRSALALLGPVAGQQPAITVEQLEVVASRARE